MDNVLTTFRSLSPVFTGPYPIVQLLSIAFVNVVYINHWFCVMKFYVITFICLKGAAMTFSQSYAGLITVQFD